MGMAMMPIMTGGVAAVPMTSSWGRRARSTTSCSAAAAALGLAVLTALMTTQRAQMLGDRTALVGSDTPMPALLPGPSGQVAGMYAVYQQTQTQVFVAALDQLMVITSVMTLVGVALAFMLRSGPAKTAGGPGEAASAAH